MKKNEYDTLVIGGGQAGVPLAHALAEAGQKTGLIERTHLGGSCINFGCTPTKAVIASARVAHLARRAAEFGLKIPKIEIDFPAVLKRARNLAADSRTGLNEGFEKSANPELIRGQARLDGKNDDGKTFRLLVGERTLTAKNIILNTGTRSLIPDIKGLDEIDFIDAGNWLKKTDLPAHLVMVGGGYISLEMSQFYRRMGSRVTVVESNPQIAGHEDADVAEAIQTALEAEGIEFHLSAKVSGVQANGENKIVVTLDADGKSKKIAASHLFIAAGRTPNTDDLGLETVGVEMYEHGIVKVDERLATTVAGIWAAGDIRGGFQFTHTAWDDYRIIESQMVGDRSRTTDRIVPYAMFTDPELGRVGMSEKDAKKSGVDFKVNCYAMKKNGKAREIGESGGFIKVIVEAKTGKIIGATVFDSEGAELVQTYVDLMNADAPFTVLRDAIHIHPTLAEATQSAVKPL